MLIYLILRLLWLPLGCQIEESGVEPNGSGEVFVGLLGGSIGSENVKFSKKFYSPRITKAALQTHLREFAPIFRNLEEIFFKKYLTNLYRCDIII